MIMDVGLNLASQIGLQAISIGSLAKATQMSKSGLFAHFKSKENIQISILRHTGQLFAEEVVVPALKVEPGTPQIKALVHNWVHWTADLPGGCIFIQAAYDFKGRPGKVRDYLIQQQQAWINNLRRIAKSAIKAGHLREDVDRDQFVFELYSLLLGFHLYYTLLRTENIQQHQEAALESLLNKYTT